MNQMSHDVPNMMGVKQQHTEKKVRQLLPGYMAMGSKGMGEMGEMNMGGPKNWVPMMAGEGPYGAMEMGGMFTVVKIRPGITSYIQSAPGNRGETGGARRAAIGSARATSPWTPVHEWVGRPRLTPGQVL
jgi:hypothetical protein